jgi:hypothetical protein
MKNENTTTGAGETAAQTLIDKVNSDHRSNDYSKAFLNDFDLCRQLRERAIAAGIDSSTISIREAGNGCFYIVQKVARTQ